MSNRIEDRLTRLEQGYERMTEEVRIAREDAAAARHLAAARDRDIADIGVKVDANRQAINALGEQTREQFDALRAEMRGGFDQLAAGQEQITGLLTRMIET